VIGPKSIYVQLQIEENVYMKRRKGRIILGTTAVAAALTLGGCAGSGNPSAEAGSSTAVTAQQSTENTADPAQAQQNATTENSSAEASSQAQQGVTAENSAEASSAGAGNTIGDFEVFDPIDNINEVVYGPPQD
jgi:protein-disulfide isomerase